MGVSWVALLVLNVFLAFELFVAFAVVKPRVKHVLVDFAVLWGYVFALVINLRFFIINVSLPVDLVSAGSIIVFVLMEIFTDRKVKSA